jgi:hypothetical protein
MAKDDFTIDTESESGTTKREAAAERMPAVLALYSSLVNGGGSDAQENLTDLLADLMHWAAATQEDEEDRVDFDAALSSAQLHFDFESD